MLVEFIPTLTRVNRFLFYKINTFLAKKLFYGIIMTTMAISNEMID